MGDQVAERTPLEAGTQELEPPWSGIRQQWAAIPEAEQRAAERLVRVQTHKPTKLQVVVELLSQHPLGANAVDRRGPTALGIQLAEGGVEPIKSLIHLGAAVRACLMTSTRLLNSVVRHNS